MQRRGGGIIRNEGEAKCLRVVEAEGTTLTAHKMGRYGRGIAGRIRAERASKGLLISRMNFDQRSQRLIRPRSIYPLRLSSFFFEADTIVSVQCRWKKLQMEKY
jgi:hypothetical protein